MTRRLSKYQITKVVLDQLNDGVWTLDQAMSKWWMTMRSATGGLRLTEMGDLAFRHAKIEFYDHPIKISIDDGWYNILIELNKKITCPYYIGVNMIKDEKGPFIRLYDSKISMLVQLYGDFMPYLNSIKVRP